MAPQGPGNRPFGSFAPGDLVVGALLVLEALLPAWVFGLALDGRAAAVTVAGVLAGFVLIRTVHQALARRLAALLGRWSSPAVAMLLPAVVAAGGMWRGLFHRAFPFAVVFALGAPWVASAIAGAPHARAWRRWAARSGCIAGYLVILLVIDFALVAPFPRYASAVCALLSSAVIAAALVLLPALARAQRLGERAIVAAAAAAILCMIVDGPWGRAAGYVRRQAEMGAVVHPVVWRDGLKGERHLASGPAPCGPPRTRQPVTIAGAARPLNVLLFTIDTVREDLFLSSGERIEAHYPNLALLAREGCRYRNMRAVGAATHLSMPAIYNATLDWLRLERPLLSAIAGHAGLRGVSLGGLYQLQVYTGLARPEGAKALPGTGGDVLDALDAAARAGQRWMIVAHDLRVHLPKLTRRDLYFDARSVYRANLASVDADLGRVFSRLKQLGQWDTTMVVVTSDHGEELNERGYFEHAFHLYETVLRIPLFVRVPGGACLPEDTRIEQVDVAPLIARSLGLSLQSPAGLGAWPPPRREVEHAFSGEGPMLATVAGGRKVIVDARYGTVESYDLLADPGERRDLGAPPGFSLPAALKAMPLPYNPYSSLFHLRGVGPDPSAACPAWAEPAAR
jgi:hypothetical protein